MHRVPIRLPIWIVILASAIPSQVTWYVATNGAPLATGTLTDPFGSVQQAITAAMPGDLILVQPGSYAGSVNYSGKTLTIRSIAGAATTILDGQAADTVVRFVSGEGPMTRLDGFRIRNGRATASGIGGGLTVSGGAQPLVINCVFTASTTTATNQSAGGIVVTAGAALRMESCEVSSNIAATTAPTGPIAGGIHCSNATLSVIGSTIRDNRGAASGMTPGVLNHPRGGAGGIDVIGGQVTLVDTSLRNNIGGGGANAQGFLSPNATIGGAGAIAALDATVTLSAVELRGNTGGWGGTGAAATNTTFGSTPSAAPSPGGAGAIWTSGTTVLAGERCFLRNNQAGRGGHGPNGFILPGTSFAIPGGFGAIGGPGAILHAGAQLTMASSIFFGNAGGLGGTGGGGTGTTFGVGSNGGGGGDGGTGGVAASGPNCVLTNCTISAQIRGAGGPGGPAGGGTYGAGSPGLPGAPGHGGVSINGAAAAISNCVVWANNPDDIHAGSAGSLMVNWTNTASVVNGTGNFNADPLWIDAPNGDFHLQPTSPCVDAGSRVAPGLPLLDIDAEPRVFHASPDMGADETILTLVLTQTGGPGTGGMVTNYNLTVGRETYNIFSSEPCAQGLGTGPFFGLYSSDPAGTLVAQLLLPLGADPVHFVATASTMVFGPYLFPFPMTMDGLSFEVVNGVAVSFSRHARVTLH